MRFAVVDAETASHVRFDFTSLAPGSAPPAPTTNAETGKKQTMKWQWQPRIRCDDCPARLYTALPDETAEKFEVHLKNRKHKAAVEERIARSRG